MGELEGELGEIRSMLAQMKTNPKETSLEQMNTQNKREIHIQELQDSIVYKAKHQDWVVWEDQEPARNKGKTKIHEEIFNEHTNKNFSSKNIDREGFVLVQVKEEVFYYKIPIPQVKVKTIESKIITERE